MRDDVLSLILDIQKQEFGLEISAQDQPDRLNVYDFYQKNGGEFWVAYIGEKIIGTVALLNIHNSHFVLRKMFVRKAFRGPYYGLARALLLQAENWAINRTAKKIFLGAQLNAFWLLTPFMRKMATSN